MKTKCSNCREENETISKYCHICGSRLPILDEQSSIFEMETKYKLKREFGLKTFLGLMIGFVVAFFAIQYLFRPSIDNRFVKMTNELNKNCPVTISADLVLKNVVALSEKTVQYNYVLINACKAEVKIDTLKKHMFPPILESVKSNPQMKILRDNKVTMRYHYSDKNGVFIVDYTIRPDMYKDVVD